MASPQLTELSINLANESAKDRADAAIAATPTIQAPDVSKIESPAEPLDIPNTTPEIGGIEQYTPEMLAERRQLQQQEQKVQGQEQDIYSALAGLGTRGAETIRAERQAGIPELSTALTDIENEIASKSLQFRRERERITQMGGSAAQVNAELADVSRKQNQELADLEVIRAARSNTLTNAQNLINRQIELKFADQTAKINALSFLYENNKDRLTKAQDQLLQKTIKREERAYQQAATEYNSFLQEQNKYLTNAAQAGADNNTLKTIKQARSYNELLSIPNIQKFSMSQGERLDMRYKEAQIANIYDHINQRGIDAYNAAIKRAIEADTAAKEEKDAATAALQKSLAGAALALELQTAPGLSSAIGFGIKKSTTARTATGIATGAATGAAIGSVVPIAGTAAGAVAGGIIGGVAGFFTSPEAAPGTSRADYEAKADQLSAMITLGGREALRGQGTITDSEQALLARAETILSNKNVSEQVWLETLQQTSEILNRANQKYAEKYGSIPSDLGDIFGIGANGLPKGAEIEIDMSGNIMLPAGMTTSDIISNEDFWK